MKTIFPLILMLIFLNGCSESPVKKRIKEEYKNLAKEYDKEITINEVEILKYKLLNFDYLANFEISRMEKLKKLRTEQLTNMKQTDSLLNANIRIRNNQIKKNFFKLDSQYLKENKADSIELIENNNERVRLEMEKIQDEIKVLKLDDLKSIERIGKSENFAAKHRIDIIIEGKRIIDTLHFFSYNNGKYCYLNKNLFIEN